MYELTYARQANMAVGTIRLRMLTKSVVYGSTVSTLRFSAGAERVDVHPDFMSPDSALSASGQSFGVSGVSGMNRRYATPDWIRRTVLAFIKHTLSINP